MKLNYLFTAAVVITFLFNQSLFASYNDSYNCRQNDSLALVAFYNNIEQGLSWDLTQPINTWWGVGLNQNGCVRSLNLSLQDTVDLNSLALKGTIAPEIGLLSELDTLNLANNLLEGEIPTTIGNLQSLSYLSLLRNNISGSIPIELGNLSRLEYLSLLDNSLTGYIPQSLINLQSLRHLSLADNNISGSIPNQIGNLQSLNYLNLCENSLTGLLPKSLGSISELDTIYLFSNNFEGCFYDELKNLCGINQISFVDDDDEGNSFDVSWYSFCEYDDGICNLYSACRKEDSLTLVHFYNNVEGNLNWDLTQPINTWQGVTLNGNGCVKVLDLNSLSLTGEIPLQIGSLNNLDTLDLSDNFLSGEIPVTFGSLYSLDYLSLANNDLTGTIPVGLGNLSELLYLSLSWNSLSGTIPESLSNLFDIKHLSLDGNELSGNIPSNLGYLFSLVYLALSENELTGTIPKTFSNLYSLDTLYLYNNYFDSCFFKELKSLCDINGIGVAIDDDDDDGGTNSFDASFYSFCERDNGVCNPYSPCRKQDSLTLVAFYNNIEGSLNWDLTKSISTWYGVGLSGYGCVEKLDLNYRNLSGSIPTELSDLINLRELYLGENALNGVIPIELSKLSNLIRLDLSGNDLIGEIPLELGNLSSLLKLDLSNNNLTGEVPLEIFELENLYSNCNSDFDFSNNNLGNCFSNLLLPYCNLMPCNIVLANNNFDATWEEFCSFNGGSCCNDRAENIILKSRNYALQESLYEAENVIEMGDGGGNVFVFPNEYNTSSFIAGKHILINTNFSSFKDANLILAIDSCQ